jgi:hypothetical protein
MWAEIFFGADTRKAARDEVFYGALIWWVHHQRAAITDVEGGVGSPAESLRSCSVISIDLHCGLIHALIHIKNNPSLYQFFCSFKPVLNWIPMICIFYLG